MSVREGLKSMILSGYFEDPLTEAHPENPRIEFSDSRRLILLRQVA